ncbi:TonB-dependent receptor [Aestuariicella sp. G3-2]|uniref:TonB-dependent receptor n=1 Tax=Pseudomaricurvus albidus TaxID=2842452 RepID=UPI001C0B76BC|nr:TonB-dependent receptor [Aestuariicella albida]MBU3071410.1 TonB-dependent receptor [Aestuariicella albida]
MKTVKMSLLSAVIAGVAGNSGAALANNLALEEVVVTAQKRTQSLQDVPISVSAMSAEKMANSGVNNFEDVSAYVPNFSVTESAVGDRISIRGIASGEQAGFEQSVGTFVDGVYRGRGVQIRNAFMDVEMVEVLRGPQGTLFGKNTIAGALNIHSAKPTDEFEAEISAGYNVDFDETDIEAYVSGPLTDTLRARLAVMDRKMDEGWVDNLYYDKEGPLKDEQAARVTLEWDVSDFTLLTFRYEDYRFDDGAMGFTMKEAGPLEALGSFNSRDESFIGNSGPVMDFGSDSVMEGDSQEASITVETQFEAGTLTGILAHSQYQYDRFLDADFSGVNGLRFDDTEDFKQNSLEVRFASEAGGSFEYITGLFYQQQDMTVDGLSYFNLPALQGILNAGCQANLGAAYGSAYVANDAVQTAINTSAFGNAALANTCAQAAAFDGVGTGVNRYAKLDQDTETLALFAQGTWNLSDTVRLTLGVRYTEEEKEAEQLVYAADFGSRNTNQSSDPLVTALAQTVGEFTAHSYTSDDPGMTRDEKSFTWSSNIQWDVNESVMAYATASTGYKSGGFNSFYMGQSGGVGANSNDVSFDEEEVLTFEVGAKMTMLDGAAEVNVAVFHTQFDDLQASIFSGGTTFEVQNAAKATSQGIEIDGRWRATEKLTVSGSLGWIDFEYDDFANQACYNSQFLEARQSAFDAAATDAEKALIALTYNNGSCAAQAVNDLEGKTSSHTPKLSASMSFNYLEQFGDYELVSNLDLNYMDEVYRQDDLDPISLDDSNVKVNASLTFGPQSGLWDVSLIGKNLTDEETFTYINDVPLFNGSHDISPNAPRSVTVRGRLRF